MMVLIFSIDFKAMLGSILSEQKIHNFHARKHQASYVQIVILLIFQNFSGQLMVLIKLSWLYGVTYLSVRKVMQIPCTFQPVKFSVEFPSITQI